MSKDQNYLKSHQSLRGAPPPPQIVNDSSLNRVFTEQLPEIFEMVPKLFNPEGIGD